ncbi:unnamed protein product [Nippostrongylus brasiliensis]|uniref:Sodium leak channel NALCN n=1 Tax=Nippostrongylus brasiliensis TaxID=27835 RepID=A0A158QXJ7_NIPBR|nr:unnamed protein product [Nippostrongylus brasiliensis]
MLARKNSSGRLGGTPFTGRESIAAISDLLTTQQKKAAKPNYVESERLESALKIACTISLITVCLHTPKTLELWWPLSHVVLCLDLVSVLILTAEVVMRIHHEGLSLRDSCYVHNRWAQFDLFMFASHWLSWLLHVYQTLRINFLLFSLPYEDWFGVVRSVRPFIIIRLIRLVVKFKLPKARIEQLLKRSSQQVQNVTVFFVFFMALYAIVDTDPNNVTIADLAIPDTMCSLPGGGGYECPGDMVCMRLNLNAKAEGFYGMFNDFGASVFTVYLAASEEGWVYVLYDCMDSLPSHLAFIYFLTLIFFLAWLVKNVFIAVITETFAEIRVQFSEMWQKKDVTFDEEFRQKLEKNEDGWRLIRLDADTNYSGTKHALQRLSIKQVGFTVLFNLECLTKILCYGIRNFFRRGIFKFEMILCIGSSLNAIKYFYDRNYFTYFQAFRLFRLIKASPILEDFVWKIFSPGKKLGGLVIFTITFVIIASAISLQLFYAVPNLHHFHTFPQAFMSMFQIITQEGWTDFVVEVLRATDDKLIVLSLFVAVILDNLEMDEELKKVKQLKAREATTSMRSTLPWRLRVFENVDSEFPMPKVRDSFAHQFALEGVEGEIYDQEEDRSKNLLQIAPSRKYRQEEPHFRHIGSISLRTSITHLLEISDRTRQSVTNSLNFLPHFSRSSGTLHPRKDALPKSRTMSGKFMHTAMRTKQMLYNENGDLSRPSDSAPKKELKQGEIDIRALQQKRHLAEITRTRIEEDMRENHPYFDRPLFLIGRASRLREFCKKVVHSRYNCQEDGINGAIKTKRRFKEIRTLIGIMPYLDWGMVTITIFSCISMLFESPWPTTGENLVMNNYYLQLLVKIVANGLFFTPKAVVSDVGGVMTMFIYFTSVAFLMWMPRHVEINSFAQLLMIFRAMRPLRVYTLVPHIRRVVMEFFRGFKEILLKIFVTRLEVYGKDNEEMHPKILVPRVWTNPRNFNFDHVGNAMLALFETLSYKGWNVIRDILWSRQGPWAVVFIHIYVFIGCMIGLTLFVGVVIANYTENRGTALLTVDQRRWHDLKARLKMAQPLHVPPKPSESARLGTIFYELTLSPRFSQVFAFLVLLNSACLIVPWNVEEEGERSTVLFSVTALSAIINILFAVEIILKVLAFTFAGFWQSRRNRIDLLITVFGLSWIFLHFFVAVPSSSFNTASRAKLKTFTYTFGYITVILRFFTIASRNSTLKMLMLTVVMGMFRSFFIITAMFLLVLFYAYTGVILFGMVKYGQAVSKHVNFRTGSEALVVLFRSITGEDWNDIMHDCMRSPPFCYWQEGMNYWNTDCGNYYGAIIYFCSFYLIITYIVRNLLVAIIMENFSLFYSSEEDALLSYADIRNFQLVWNMVDREQKRSIPVGRVKFLLRLLKGRLEVDPEKDRILFKHMCYEMDKLHNGDDVSFHDVLYMLSYRSVDIRKSLQLEELLQREELEFIIEEEVAKQTIRTWLENCLRRIRNPLRQKDSLADNVKNPGSGGLMFGSSLDQDVCPIPLFRFAQEDSSSAEDVNPLPFQTPTILQEAAKKFMQSNSEKKLAQSRAPRLPEVAQLLPKRPETKKTGGSKTLHLNVYDLPDLEEKGEDGTFSPPKAKIDIEEKCDPSAPLMCNAISPGIPSPGNPNGRVESTQDISMWWEFVSQ